MVRKYFCKDMPAFHPKQLKILFHIASKKEYNIITQTNIANTLDMPITTINHHIRILRKEDFVDKLNHLRTKGKQLLRYFKHWDKTFQKKLRAHKIQVVFYLSKIPKSLIENKMGILTPFTNKRYKGLKGEILGCRMMYYGRKMVVVLPDIYGSNDEEISSAMMDFSEQLINTFKLEWGDFEVAEYKVCKFSSMHVAILDSVIAEQYILKHKRCYSDGRIAVDNSHKRFELEAENGYTALEDIEVLVKWEDLVAENERLKKIILELNQNRGSTVKNVKKQ